MADAPKWPAWLFDSANPIRISFEHDREPMGYDGLGADVFYCREHTTRSVGQHRAHAGRMTPEDGVRRAFDELWKKWAAHSFDRGAIVAESEGRQAEFAALLDETLRDVAGD